MIIYKMLDFFEMILFFHRYYVVNSALKLIRLFKQKHALALLYPLFCLNLTQRAEQIFKQQTKISPVDNTDKSKWREFN